MISNKKKCNLWFVFCVAVFIFVAYGSQFFNTDLRIDNEDLINNPGTFQGWAHIGRFGFIFIKYLFNVYVYNPFFEVPAAFFILGIIFFIWKKIFEEIFNSTALVSFIFTCIFWIHPIFVEQFYFSLQIFPMSLGLLILSVCILLQYKKVLSCEHDNLYKIILISLMVLAFGCYQILCVVYVAFVVLSFIFISTVDENSNDETGQKKLLKLFFTQIILFLIAAIVYFVLVKLFFSGSEYLNNLKTNSNIVNHIKVCIGHFWSCFLPNNNLYVNYFYPVSVIFMLIIGFVELFRTSRKEKYLFFACILFFEFLPFALTLYLGNKPVVRAQLVLPLVLGGNISFCVWYFHKRAKLIYKFFICIAIAAFMLQLQMVERMNYSDHIRKTEDLRLISQIEERIRACCDEDKPKVIFVGTYRSKLNNVCVRGELIGNSILGCDCDVKPYYFYSTNRIIGMNKNLGIDYIMPTKNEVEQARKISYDMPTWPNKYCVKNVGDYVIVKLGVDEFYIDDFEDGKNIETIQAQGLNFADAKDINFAIDTIANDQGKIIISGWCYADGNTNKNFSICLLDQTTNKIFKLNTYTYQRLDVNKAFNLKDDYKCVGIKAKIDIAYIDQIKNSKVVLMCDGDKQNYCVYDTGIGFADKLETK